MLWFQEGRVAQAVRDLPLYALKQTEGRLNVQIYIGRLDDLKSRFNDFLLVIHDGRRNAYYVPYSFLRQVVIPYARIRERPRDPRQRYFTVDQVRGERHVFSFGLDRFGNPLRVNLAEFHNTVGGPEGVQTVLRPGLTIPDPFRDGEGPFILGTEEAQRYGLDPNSADPVTERGRALRRSLESKGAQCTSVGGRVVVRSSSDVVSADQVVDIYDQMLSQGHVRTDHVRRPAAFRPYQKAFKEALTATYGSLCAMCDVDIRNALVASHIVPASSDRLNRANLANGILLCGLHDALFDDFLITLESDYKVAVAPYLVSSSRHIEEWVLAREGESIRLPSRHPPDQEFLTWHSRRTLGE